MNKLKQEKKELVLNLLTEGNTIRGIQRLTGVHQETTIKLIREVGKNCQRYMDEKMKDLDVNRVEVDEIWTYIQKKQNKLKPEEKKLGVGDCYIFVAIDAESKLIPCFRAGKRTEENSFEFIQELQQRIVGRFQLTTDAFKGYQFLDTVGFRKRVDYAQLIKVFEGKGDKKTESYSPTEYIKLIPSVICGNPDPKYISTSFVERQNLTMRTQMRRFTRLTNAFSKKLDCLIGACAIHFWHYNFMRLHSSLKCTPAMEAGIANSFLDWSYVIN